MDIIFTKHVKTKMQSRNMKGVDIENTVTKYDKKSMTKETVEFYKKIGSYEYKVIAKENSKDWIIISAWVNPPLPGSFDLVKKERYRKYLKANLIGKIWMQTKRSLLGWEF